MDPNLNTLPRPLKIRICRASSLKYKLLNSYFDSQQLLLCQTELFLKCNDTSQTISTLRVCLIWVPFLSGWAGLSSGCTLSVGTPPFLSHGWDSLTAVNI